MDTGDARTGGQGARTGAPVADRTPGAARSRTMQLVRASWDRLAERQEPVVEGFYARLFELDPDLASLFAATDMDPMRAKFADTIRMLLTALDDGTALLPLARRSGERHAVYGVRDRDYRTGGEALLWALARELGDDFTPEVRAAWAEAYTRLADAMARAAR
ncbi:MAG TPA: globin domain-containing protein [Longimicrobiales bacterium]|nr:globin domain-containing protein [Longimicrobiales bacterium]